MVRYIYIRRALLILITTIVAIVAPSSVQAEETPQVPSSDQNPVNEMIQQDLGEMADSAELIYAVPDRLNRKPGFSKITVSREMSTENDQGLSDQMSTQPLESQPER